MDHKLSRLFRPTLVAHPGRYKVNHSEDELAALSITAKNLDTLLDFSSVKSNIDEITISKFSRGEQKILENYRYIFKIFSEVRISTIVKVARNLNCV